MKRLMTAAATAVLCVCAGWLIGEVRGQCPGGESPSDFCDTARVLSGSAGTQVIVMNTSAATATSESACGVPIGHSVWFVINPSVSGLVTFTTCHPSTTYDTVVDVFAGGSSMCEFMTAVTCNDDTPLSECGNGCSAFGSTVRFNVTAGTLYRIRVGSYNNNAAGCNLCLGAVVSVCDGDSTAPSVSISTPGPYACLCWSSVAINGTVSDSGSGVARYTVDYRAAGTGAWTLISSGIGNITGVLGTWDTTGLSDGEYTIRVSARDGCGNASSEVTTLRVDAAVDSGQLRWPASGAVVGGTVIADGTAWDACSGTLEMQWKPLSGSTWNVFGSINPPWVLNDPLGSWNTRTVADGNYQARLVVMTTCVGMYYNSDITVDNTAPIAVITTPQTCRRFPRGVVLQVRGTAADANLDSWKLEYSNGGPWVTIASGTTAVTDGVLANWNTAGLPWCRYVLRLSVVDRSVIDSNSALRNRSEDVVLIDVGCVADVNDSGTVSVQDIFDFLAAYFAGCP
jgi:hypothetical protein